MKPWKKMTNDELVMHLELWLALDGTVKTYQQREFFEEIMWRLQMMNTRIKEDVENGS